MNFIDDKQTYITSDFIFKISRFFFRTKSIFFKIETNIPIRFQAEFTLAH